MKGSIITLAFFATGILLGYKAWLPEVLLTHDISTYALYVLMFLVGVGIGGDSKMREVLSKINLKILLVPLTTIIGTLIGVTIVFTMLEDYSLREYYAVGSGFGYYSLSSIIIKEIGQNTESLAVIALLSNILREIFTLLFSPFFAKFFGKLAPIVSGGATSMDVTLPIITTYSGKDYAFVSLFNGVILTLLVPVFVAFFMA